eukprot:TRINITY_DN21961_c0_g1_i1.p1 TRINITY_DN21961_c0_g1~~TRINITY_DN21961_c0_g1_i1.p1  ORF type:complete len:283 (+),score=57.17 TRINITY_DN21961_c0_g1_i1:31-879(+)
MASSRVFTKITKADCSTLRGTEGEDTRAELKRIYSSELGSYQSEHDTTIIVDLLYHATVFGIEQFDDDAKLSVFVSLLFDTHQESMDQKLQLLESIKLFESKLVSHSVHRPPKTVCLFNAVDLSAIHTFVVDTYYRHYKMYLYVFSTPTLLTVSTGAMQVVVPQQPVKFRPLSEGVPENVQPEQATSVVADNPEVQDQPAASTPPPPEDGAAVQGEVSDTASPSEPVSKPKGLKAQMASISSEVSKMSHAKLDALEERIAELEAQQQANPAKGQKAAGKKKG